MTKGKIAELILDILDCEPMSASQICEKLPLKDSKIGRDATSKRLERLSKEGKIGRYLRIKNGAYIYYIPGKHSNDLLQQVSRRIVIQTNGTLSRILQIIIACKILSVHELSRIANVNYYDNYNKASPIIGELLNKLAKLGINQIGTNLLLSSIQPSEANSLEAVYNTALDREAYLLTYARRIFLSKGLAEDLTLYRQPSTDSLAINKFDLFGHAGRRNRIRIIIECNLRREVTPADLEGFCQRVGGTIKKSKLRKKLTDRSPVARYSKIIDGVKVYNDLFAKFVDYRGLETKVLESEKRLLHQPQTNLNGTF